MDYLRDPAEITRRSFEIVRAEAELDALPDALQGVAVRLVHACGMPDIVGDLAWRPGVAEQGRAALLAGAPVLADCRMVADGVIRGRLPAGNDVICALDDPQVPALARHLATTRSAAAVELWRDALAGAVVAVGNAPTALFRLIELLAEGAPRPAAILAFPVGFVGAAESKEALIEADLGVPFVTLRGRRGGSRACRRRGQRPGGGGAMTKWLSIVGLGEDGLAALAPAARSLIDTAEVLVGGRRHLAMVPAEADERRERLAWPSPFDALADEIAARRGRRVCVLATGDPMNYGVGARLARRFPIEDMIRAAVSLGLQPGLRAAWLEPAGYDPAVDPRPAAGDPAPGGQPGARLLVLTSGRAGAGADRGAAARARLRAEPA